MSNQFCNEPSLTWIPRTPPSQISEGWPVICLDLIKTLHVAAEAEPRNGSPSATALPAWEQACPAGLASNCSRIQCKCQIQVSLPILKTDHTTIWANIVSYVHYQFFFLVVHYQLVKCLYGGLSELLVFNKIQVATGALFQILLLNNTWKCEECTGRHTYRLPGFSTADSGSMLNGLV